MEFPAPRVMKDMLLLPPGDIILLGEASSNQRSQMHKGHP